MTLTTETIAGYLGRQASAILADLPFKYWTFEKSVETDLAQPLIDYVFARNGVDFVCDENETVRSIFLYSNEFRCFKEGLQDIPFTSTRQDVVNRLGSPSKSGSRTSHPILGEYGGWDRFARPGYAIHVEYGIDADCIKKITLMRADVVP